MKPWLLLREDRHTFDGRGGEGPFFFEPLGIKCRAKTAQAYVTFDIEVLKHLTYGLWLAQGQKAKTTRVWYWTKGISKE